MDSRVKGMINLGHLHGVPVRAGAGLRARQLPGVIILEADPPKRNRSAPRTPFFVRSTGTVEAPFVTVTPGTVNNYEPTTDDVDPWILEIPTTGTHYVVIKAALNDAGTLDAATIEDDLIIYVTDEIPEQLAGDENTGAPPAWAYRVVAEVVADDGVLTITNYLSASQWVSLVVSNWGCTNITRNVVWTQ